MVLPGRDDVPAWPSCAGTRLGLHRRQPEFVAAAAHDGFQTVGAANPSSGPFRAAARRSIIDLAARGKLAVPIAATFPLSDVRRAVEALAGNHPYGKLALVA